MQFESSRDDLEPAEFAPGQIKSGEPKYRAKTYTVSPDGHLTCGMWDCTAGSFTWFHGTDEIVQILEGEVIVDGQKLVPGSVAYFEQGRTTMWEVPKYVKKTFVLRAVQPRSTFRRVKDVIKRRIILEINEARARKTR